MKNGLVALLVVVTAPFANLSVAADLSGVTIKRLYTYSSFDANFEDIGIALSEPCPGHAQGGGWFIPAASFPDNKNTQNLYSLALAAFMAGKTIDIYYEPGKNPSYASADNYCEIRGMSVIE